MARINLLPWREASRERRRRQFLQMLVAMVMVGGGVILLVDAYVNRVIERQHLRNQYLQQATARLDKQIASIEELKVQRQQLLERMGVIEDLQGNRSTSVRVFEHLARSLPEGVYFTEVDLQGQNLGISGAAESNNRVSDLMRNLQAAEGLAVPSLTEVKRAVDTQQGLGNLFRLNVGQAVALSGEPRQ
jgi:type IV pilus assembly protein PilN